MLPCCLKCKKNTQSNDPIIVKTSNGKIIMLSRCDICVSKKPKFIKK